MHDQKNNVPYSYILGLIAFAAFHTSQYMENSPDNTSEQRRRYKVQEPAFPEKVAAIKSWNKETFKENVDRIARDPTRLQRLLAFQTFIHHEEERELERSEKHWIGGETLPLFKVSHHLDPAKIERVRRIHIVQADPETV